jgi:transketolase C-terminal domain/subunit
LPLGRGEIRRDGRSGLAILSFGSLLESALAVGERLDATVVNMRFVKPLDENLVLRLIARHRGLVTVEENAVAGGAGSAVAELLAASGSKSPQLLVGIPARGTTASRLPAWIRAACSARSKGGGSSTIRTARDSSEGKLTLGGPPRGQNRADVHILYRL